MTLASQHLRQHASDRPEVHRGGAERSNSVVLGRNRWKPLETLVFQ